jgi:HEAT repeat protein
MPSAAGQRSEDEVAESIQILLDQSADPQSRATALEAISLEVAKRHDLIDVVLGLLRDPSEPRLLRWTALNILRASSFRAAMFAPKRPDFLDTLRSIIDDPDLKLREQALEVLAQEKDEYAQRRLLEGLENPASALVPPEKALQFLGYDIHAEHYALLRDLVRKPPNPIAKLEAVRLLASDASSKDLLTEVLLDRGEDPEIRSASAAALQSLAPAEFEELAQQIVLDDNEDDRLRAAAMSALDHFGESGSTTGKSEFLERIKQLQNITSGELKRAANRFVTRRQE